MVNYYRLLINFIHNCFQTASKNGFAPSLFNRLHQTRELVEDGVIMLNVQYRMASEICNWPSEFFYGGKLLTSGDIEKWFFSSLQVN